MKKQLLITLALGVISFSSCTTKKGTQDASNNKTEMTEDQIARETEISKAGYIKAEIIDKGGKDGCDLILKDLNSGTLYNPVSWLIEEYKKAGNIVYVKYRSSRAAQTGCFDAQMIIIDEIKLVNP